MKLNIQERLILVNLLPEKGNFETMSTIEGLKMLLYPTEAEVKKFEVKQESNAIHWNKEGAKQNEIKISDKQKEILMRQLVELDKKESLDFNQYSVFKRFKEEKE